MRRFIAKFEKDIDYAEKYFPDHERHFMLWSPIVKDQREGAKYNQMRDVEQVVEHFRNTRGVEIEPVINERFHAVLEQLREYAASQTQALTSPLLRLMQIETRLEKHLGL